MIFGIYFGCSVGVSAGERREPVVLEMKLLFRFCMSRRTKFAAQLIFFTIVMVGAGSPALANPPPTPPSESSQKTVASSQKTLVAQIQKVDEKFHMCVDRSRSKFTELDKKKIGEIRLGLEAHVRPFLSGANNSEGEFNQVLAKWVDQDIPSNVAASAHLVPAIQFAVLEARLQFLMRLYSNPKMTSFQGLLAVGKLSIYHQTSVDLVKFKKMHDRFMREILEGEEANFTELRSIMVAANMLSQQVFESQTQLAAAGRDSTRFYYSLAQQAGLGTAGFGALIGTMIVGPAWVAKGGALAVQLGAKVLAGEMAAGSLVGALGGPGAEAFRSSLAVTSQSYFRSLQSGTPWNCELQKSVALSELHSALRFGLVAGSTAGSVGALAGHYAPKATLILATAAVGTGFLYESGMFMYEAYKAAEYYRLVKSLESLTDVDEDSKYEQKILITTLWREFYARAQRLVKHGGDAVVIGLLFDSFFRNGEFKGAKVLLQQAYVEGRQRVKELMAYSSDTVPSVGMSTVDISSLGAVGVHSWIFGADVRYQKIDISERVNRFLERIRRLKPSVLVENQLQKLPQADLHFMP